ncbi:MAG: FAD-dependent monooxygenase [Rhizobiaceae bacterium]
MTDSDKYDVAISGGGLAGLTAAHALGLSGRSVALCAPQTLPETDRRTTALLNDSVEYLNQLELWEALAEKSCPLKTMRLVDGTRRLFRIQQTDFQAQEIGIDAFGYNVRNSDVLNLLGEKLCSNLDVTLIDANVEALETSAPGEIKINLKTADGASSSITTGFIIGADGRNSLVRKHYGHGERKWSYPQSAIVVDFKHQHATGFASTEFHTESGPFTIVPQGNYLAGLVWLEEPSIAKQIASLPEQELNLLLEEKMQSFLGKITVVDDPQIFPISGMTANRFGDQGHALIGEAAHVFPPIGAQGFNLGIRDIRDLVNILGKHADTENAGYQYHLSRIGDINTRTMGVDLLNRSLLSGFLPVQMIRSAGIFALNNIPPLRKQAMKLGMSPIFNG